MTMIDDEPRGRDMTNDERKRAAFAMQTGGINTATETKTMFDVRPSSVKIGPHVYRIYFSKEDWNRAVVSGNLDNPNSLGYTNHDTTEIFIRSHARNGFPKMSGSQEKGTLLHEIMHACFGIMGCNLDNVRYREQINLEEFVVSTLEPYLFMALHENRDVFAWITS